MTPEEINKAVEGLIDPDGRSRQVAHDLILRLLQEENTDHAYNALVAAAAVLIFVEVENDKDNAEQMALDLGRHIAGHIIEQAETIADTRDRYMAFIAATKGSEPDHG